MADLYAAKDPSAPWGRPCGALAIAVLLALLCFGAFVERSSPLHERSMQAQAYMRGEPLWYGIEDPEIAYAMPLSGIWESAVETQPPPAARRRMRGLIAAASLLLVFALGTLLHSPLCGALASLASWKLELLSSASGAEDSLFILLILIVSGITAWKTRSADPGEGLLLGAVTGLALLARSTLFLLPFFLAAALWNGGAGDRHGRVVRLLPLFALPCLMLAPWVLMNAAVHGAFIPFEHTRADNNIIAGALGLVSTVHGGDIASFAGLGTGTPVHLWAAGHILRHPILFTTACVERAVFSLGEHPFLLLFAVAAAWRFRRRREFRALTAVAGYFFAVHWLMGVELRYFAPIWPVMAALAAAVPAHLLDARGGTGSKAFAAALLAICVLAPAAAGAAAMFAAGRYPARRAPAETALARGLRASPQDAWLWAQRGRRRLESGRTREAARDFSRALTLDPRTSREVDLAWALAVAGGGARDLIVRIRLDGPDALLRGGFLRASVLVELGRQDEALAAFAEGMARERADCGTDIIRTEIDRRVTEALCSPHRRTPAVFDALLSAWPAERRFLILARLSGSPEAGTAFLLAAARAGVEAGRRREAERILDSASAALSGPAQLLEKAKLYSAMGKRSRALEAVRAVEALQPGPGMLFGARKLREELGAPPAEISP